MIVVDAAHGGADNGAQFTDTLAEKDVTLALARRIRSELVARGFVPLMMRDADTALTFDQRAAAANSASATLYLAIHASTLGNGVRIYSAAMPAQAPGAARTVLVGCGRAQSTFSANSHRLAAAVGSDMTSKNLPTTATDAAVLPLNGIGALAIALEFAPPPGNTDVPAVALNLPSYQQTVASALADSIAAERSILSAPVRPGPWPTPAPGRGPPGPESAGRECPARGARGPGACGVSSSPASGGSGPASE